MYDFLDQEQRDELELRTYLFVKKESKINHSKLDKEKYEKILKNEVDIEEKEGIFGCFNYFKKEIEILKQEINLSEFVEFIKYSKLWVVVCLNANEDEQKIFDSINSTGQRLSSTDIVKNALFDKIIKVTNEDKAMQYYKEYWDSVFDKDENEQEFWNEEIETGRIKRNKSEIFLFSYAIIKGIFNTEIHNLSNLSLLYKEYIKNLNENDLKELLKELKDYARIYRNFPDIDKNTVLKYEDYESRFFHI
ncbi:hypothetical protein A0U25_06600, partial [Campylobacter lari]|nr:hypothetical protein [Campylobacter lari]